MLLEDFINRSNIIHSNYYDYSAIPQNVDIVRSAYCMVSIICPIHGVFNQRTHDHLLGRGCRRCGGKSSSHKALTWLEYLSNSTNLHIQHAANHGEYFLPDLKMFVDGYCAITNTVYEFDGDAFHGNPARYNPTDNCQPYDKTVTAEQLHATTIARQHKIRNAGYNLTTIWESDFDQLSIPVKRFSNIIDSRIDPEYPNQLILMGLEIQGQYQGSKIRHQLKCLICSGIHAATPLSKIQGKKHHPDNYGCPQCNKKTTDQKNKLRGNYEARLQELNYKASDYVNAQTKCNLECMICGKQKSIKPSIIIQRNVPCCRLSGVE